MTGIREITVLGPVGIRLDGEPVEVGPSLRRLLAALVAGHGGTVSVDRLADIVWDGNPPRSADRTLKSYVTRLRRALDAGREAIEFRAPGYALTIVEQVDSRRFEADLDDALMHLRTADHEEAAACLDRAIARWRGRAFAGFADEAWARPEAVRLEERLVEAQAAQIDVFLARGADERAVAAAIALVEAEPLRERPRALLMTALYASGRQADALRQFRSYAELLADETGLTPSSDLSELEGQIVRGEVASASSTTMLRGYRLAERIGEGAFAVVHAGVQPGLERDVAIKIIRSELADRPEFIRRFEFEARTVARLEHPHIVPLYDFWREPGAGYLVMRLMRGGSAEGALRKNGPYSTTQLVALLDDIGGALTTAHRLGVVHRDVRPANLLLDTDGATYLADFGIAVAIAEHDRASVFQPAYAAPEVLRGQPATPAADVLSLGVTVFELLTGRLPFADSNDRAELIRRQLDEPLPPVRATRPELSDAIDDVLARATAKAPSDRYSSIAALTSDLSEALTSGHLGRRPSNVRSRALVVPNPYVGLHAFDETDADRFAGREALTASIIAAVEQHRLVAVVGPSGSGKSSVVRAGVVPALRRGAVAGSDQWFVATMVPGAEPIASLEAALLRVAVNPPASLREQLTQRGGLLRAVRRILPSDHAHLLVVIDQFEELFTQTTNTSTPAAFLDELALAISSPDSPLHVIATLRADHYGAPLGHRTMAPLVSAGAVSVTPMSPDELERAITAPARSIGADVEGSLVATLVAEMANNPSALPLMQFALTEAFDRRAGDVMMRSSYEEAGGLSGALAARADRIIDQSGADENDVRRIFSRLVAIGDDVDDARRRARRSEFGSDERIEWLLDAFIAARLLSSDADDSTREPTIEVAHESLLTAWPRLRRWITDDRSDLVVLQSTTRAATDWDDGGRDDGDLARAGRLATVSDLAARRSDWLNPTEQAWIAASVAADDAETAERQRQVELTHRQNRRLRRTLVVAVVLLVATTMAAGAALVLRSRAIESERDADVERLVALSASQIVAAPDRAILLALEAYRQRPGVSTIGAVQRALATESRFVAHRLPTLGEGARSLISGDGSVAFEHVVLGERTRFAFVDIASDEPLADPVQLDVRADFVAISADGTVGMAGQLDDGVMFAIRPDGTITPLDAAERPTSAHLDRSGDRVLLDDLPIAAAGDTSILTMRVIDGATGDTISEREIPFDGFSFNLPLGLSPDGARYAFSSFGNIQRGDKQSTTIVDATTGADIATHPSAHGETLAFAWAPSGGYAIGYQDGTIEAFDEDDSPPRVLVGHADPIDSIAVGSNGVTAAAATDGSLRLWDPGGAPLGSAIAFERSIVSLAASPDGNFQVAFGDGARTSINPDAGALVDLTRDVPFSAVDARSPNYEQPRFERRGDGAIVSGGITRRLADDELVLEIDYLPDLPNGSGQPPFVSIDSDWMVAFDLENSLPRGLIYDITGEHRIAFDPTDLNAQDGTDPNDPGWIRVSAGGDRLIALGSTSTGQARVSAFSLPELELVAGPLELVGGDHVLLELASGEIIASGGIPDGTSPGQGPVQIVDRELSMPLREVANSSGLFPLHQSPDGQVLLGANDGRVAVLDPDSLELRYLNDVDSPVAGGAIAPDGRTAAVTSRESGVQLLDITTGARIGVPMPGTPENRRGSNGVRWTDDSQHVWIDPTGPVQRFIATPEGWIERACSIAGRNLTDTEWDTYVSLDGNPRSSCE